VMERHPKPDRALVAALIASAANAKAEDARLQALVRRREAGADDRTEPGAREWLRRWGPRPMAAPRAECACSAGRCGWCN